MPTASSRSSVSFATAVRSSSSSAAAAAAAAAPHPPSGASPDIDPEPPCSFLPDVGDAGADGRAAAADAAAAVAEKADDVGVAADASAAAAAMLSLLLLLTGESAPSLLPPPPPPMAEPLVLILPGGLVGACWCCRCCWPFMLMRPEPESSERTAPLPMRRSWGDPGGAVGVACMFGQRMCVGDNGVDKSKGA
eukprot:343122-Chlamydomonas_euryale.AAC.6